MPRLIALLASFFLLLPGPAPAPENVDLNMQKRIRAEGMEHSQIMHTMHFFADIYGPRLTGSPSLKAAGDWAVKQMTDWGFDNAHLEPWDFGHPGWVNDRLSAYMVTPVMAPLYAKALAWTPSTKGKVSAQVYHMIPPDRPTEEALTKFLDGEKSKVKGMIVLVGKPAAIPVEITPPPRRIDDKANAERYDPNNPNAGQFGRGGRRGGQEEQGGPPRLTAVQANAKIDLFLIANGAKVRVNDSAMDHGEIRAFHNRTYDPKKALPTLVMRNEDFGRVARIVADGAPVKLEVEISNRWFPEGKTAYNTIGEIQGTDKKDEVVMLGGHLDSWHSATGATDNAIGCATMMEAARILKAVGAKPRRTIRVACWSGEEEGLLGSQAYVKEHFGSFEDPKPDFAKLDAYFNIDAGTGRARGAGIFGPAEAATILREVLAPFADLGVAGALAGRSRNVGGSDHTSFNHAGLPGVSMGQDPIEYFNVTWHTNLDTYERIIEADVKSSAVVIAAEVYHLAMRNEMVPRFAKDTMPALPPPAPGQ